MKVILSFSLPEERDESEQAIHGGEWCMAVYDIVNELRNRVKYGEAGKEVESFKEWVWQMLNDRGLDPYKE